MIAYGSKLNLAYPSRPTDPAAALEPEWEAKIRVKSVLNTMPGMEEAMQPTASDPSSWSESLANS
jgi:hypothetical protein